MSFRQYFPDFLWLLRDVTLDLTDEQGRPLTATQYLTSNVLKRSRKLIPTTADHVAMAITSYFSSVECLALAPPSSDRSVTKNIPEHYSQLHPDFTEGLKDAIDFIHQKVKRKRGFDADSMDGALVASLAEQYVTTVNEPGGIPTLESAWQNVITTRMIELNDQLAEEYQMRMEENLHDKLPMEEDNFFRIHQELLDSLLKRLDTEINRLQPTSDDPSFTNRQEVRANFTSRIIQWTDKKEVKGGSVMLFIQKNEKESSKACVALFDQKFQKIQEKLDQIAPTQDEEGAAESYTYDDFLKDLDELETSYHIGAVGPSKQSVFEQKWGEVIEHYKKTFKQLSGFSQQLMETRQKAEATYQESQKLGEKVAQLSRQLNEKEKEMLRQAAERERTLRELEETQKQRLEQELAKQNELRAAEMKEALEISEQRYQEIQEQGNRRLQEVKKMYDNQIAQTKKGRHAVVN